MHDIDARINELSGQTNYMEKLQQFTGNIYTVDREMYKSALKRITAAEFNIGLLLTRLDTEQHTDAVQTTLFEHTRLSRELDLKNTVFVIVEKTTKKGTRPPKEVIAPGRQPVDLLKTDWFKHIKLIEKTVHKFIRTMCDSCTNEEHPKLTYDVVESFFAENPNQLELRTVFGLRVNTESVFKAIMQLHQMSSLIVEKLLVPMYDIKRTIQSHWSQISQIFKVPLVRDNPEQFTEDYITEILQNFIIAKYRTEVTGNKKHYVKLFMSTVGDETMSNMDGARFMEIMDSIDLDKLDKKEKVYKFAVAAKSTLKTLSEHENMKVDEMIESLNKLFDDEQLSEADREAMAAEDVIV